MKTFNTVPNGYTYISGKNNKFQKLGESWINCQTGTLVESYKVPKLETAAKYQIEEYNSYLHIKIGQLYESNNTFYEYLGNNHFSLNGNMLSESVSSGILTGLMEDDSTPDVEIPLGYTYTTPKNRSYVKKPKGWLSLASDNYLNQSAVAGLEDAAKRAIQKHNETEATPIGYVWTSNKKIPYTYVGNNTFVGKNGRVVPAHVAEQILNKNKRLHDEKKQREELNKVSADGSVDLQPDAFGDEVKKEPSKEPSLEPNNLKTSEEPKSSSDVGGSSSLESLASTIMSHPYKRKITILLGRGDAVSLLAADILLSNKTKEAVDILNSLNKG